jgi:Zn-dependent peptidase ImmA (M78 family)
LTLLFRSTASSRPDLGVESAAAFVEAAIKILPPRAALPEWFSDFAFSAETYDEAGRLADEFRLRFIPDRLDDPLLDLPEILIRLGVIIGRLETSRFEGASAVTDGYAFIFVSPRFSGRMLFTLAHELGHLIAHHKERRAVVFDRATQIGGRRHLTRPESFVDAFASALLMPASGVGKALRTIRKTLWVQSEVVGDVELLYLARFYGVSFDVAARRCEDLGLLPRGGAISLADHIRELHGSPEKRAEALGLPARPTIYIPHASSNLLKTAVSQIERGNVSLGWVTDRLGCTANDIYAARAVSEAARGPHH